MADPYSTNLDWITQGQPARMMNAGGVYGVPGGATYTQPTGLPVGPGQMLYGLGSYDGLQAQRDHLGGASPTDPWDAPGLAEWFRTGAHQQAFNVGGGFFDPFTRAGSLNNYAYFDPAGGARAYVWGDDIRPPDNQQLFNNYRNTTGTGGTNPPPGAGGTGPYNPIINVHPPTYNPPTYTPPTYNPPNYGGPTYNPPTYTPPNYTPPNYGAPTYNPPVYNSPAPPTYNPPVYNPPTYNPPSNTGGGGGAGGAGGQGGQGGSVGDIITHGGSGGHGYGGNIESGAVNVTNAAADVVGAQNARNQWLNQWLTGLGRSYENSYLRARSANQMLYDQILHGYGASGRRQVGMQQATSTIDPNQNLLNPWTNYERLDQSLQDYLRPMEQAYSQHYMRDMDQIGRNYNRLPGEVMGELNPMRQGLEDQSRGQHDTVAGYGLLRNRTLGEIGAIEDSERQRIADQYAMAQGTAEQDLISRGLGNTTVRSSVMRGLDRDKAKAGIDLSGRMADLYAGYGSQIGLAGLDYAGRSVEDRVRQQNQIADAYSRYKYQTESDNLQFAERGAMGRADQLNRIADARTNYAARTGFGYLDYRDRAAQQNTALDLAQFDWMDRTQIPYPDASQYALLASQFGGLFG